MGHTMRSFSEEIKNLAITPNILDQCSKLALALGTIYLTYRDIKILFTHAERGTDIKAIEYIKDHTHWSREKSAGYYGTILEIAKPFLFLRQKLEIANKAKFALDEEHTKYTRKLQMIQEAAKNAQNPLDDLDFGAYSDNMEEREALRTLEEIQKKYIEIAQNFK